MNQSGQRADRINATLEYFGVLFAAWNCFILVRDSGQVMGVSIASTVFFTVWGVWNLWYYPHLGQTASGIAAIGLVIANGVWLSLYVLYGMHVL